MDSVPKKKKMKTLDSYFSNDKTKKVSSYIGLFIFY